MKRKGLLAAAFVFAVMTGNLIVAPDAKAGPSFEAFAGTYVVVAVRQNSFVAAPLGMRPTPSDTPIGKTVTFGSKGVSMEGIACDDWRAAAETPSADFMNDRLLVDRRLPPTDSPLSDGDKRLSESYKISCEGEFFTTLFQVDRRVVVLSWANAQQYLILERPLNAEQVRKLQKALTSTKFYSGKITGEFDTETERAVRAWYKYRQPDRAAAIPRRPAITENLLDALRVLN